MRKLLGFILGITMPILVFSQTGTVKGKISNQATELTIPGIHVSVEGTSMGTVTSGNGFYEIKDIPAGNYKLMFSGIGFVKLVHPIEIVDEGNLVLDLEMVEDITQLPSVVVESVTLTGGLSNLDNVTGSAFYVSPKEIERYNYSDINRVLRNVPGINIQEEDGFGLRPNIGLRGVGSERSSKITLMEDGILIAPAPYTAPSAYYFPTVGRMHGVEILKGSSQIRFGPYTTGGALNLISTPLPMDFSGYFNFMAGTYGNSNLHAWVGNRHKNFAYMAEVYQYGSDGFKDLDNNGPTGFDKKDFTVKASVNTGPDAKYYQSFTLKAGYNDEISNETYLGLTDNDFKTNPLRRYNGSQTDIMNANHKQLSARYSIQLSNKLEIAVTGYVNEFNRNWYKLDKVQYDTSGAVSISKILNDPDKYANELGVIKGLSNNGAERLSVKSNNRTYYSKGIQMNGIYAFTKGKWHHKILIGLRLHTDKMDRFQHLDKYNMVDGSMGLVEKGVGGTESNRVQSATAFAAYIDYTLQFGKVTFRPGIRFEQMEFSKLDYGKNDPERTGSSLKESGNNVYVLIPGIGVDYKFNKYVSVFIGIHKGFAPPGSQEGTEPEESINYELGSRIKKGAVRGEFVAYFNDYSNLLGSDQAANGGTGSGDMFNAGEARSYGIEMLFSYDFLYFSNSSFSLPFNLVYTYTDGIFLNGFESGFSPWGEVMPSDKIPYIPAHQLAGSMSLEHKSFEFNIGAKYTSAMRTEPGQGKINPLMATDAHVVIDAGAKVKLHKQISFSVQAYNLTNTVYIAARRPAGVRPGMPATIQAGIKAVF